MKSKKVDLFDKVLLKDGEQVLLVSDLVEYVNNVGPLDKDIVSIWPVGGPPDPGKQK